MHMQYNEDGSPSIHNIHPFTTRFPFSLLISKLCPPSVVNIIPFFCFTGTTHVPCHQFLHALACTVLSHPHLLTFAHQHSYQDMQYSFACVHMHTSDVCVWVHTCQTQAHTFDLTCHTHTHLQPFLQSFTHPFSIYYVHLCLHQAQHKAT